MTDTARQVRQDLQRQLRDLDKRSAAKLATAIIALERRTQRAGATLNFAASGAQQLDLTWPQTFPDDQYGVWVQLYTGNPAQVHAVPLLATKTAAGISISVTAASAVGNVGVDVLAVRT